MPYVRRALEQARQPNQKKECLFLHLHLRPRTLIVTLKLNAKITLLKSFRCLLNLPLLVHLPFLVLTLFSRFKWLPLMNCPLLSLPRLDWLALLSQTCCSLSSHLDGTVSISKHTNKLGESLVFFTTQLHSV